MDKIKLENKPIKNKIIRIGKQKVEIRPYISTEDMLLITDLSLQKISDGDNFFNSICIHNLFDMYITEICTNIHIDGINIENTKTREIEINLEVSDFIKYDISNIHNVLSKYIINYELCWKSLFEIMQIYITKNSIDLVAKQIPNSDSLKGIVSDITNSIDYINKKDPETFKNLIRIADENNTFKRAKEEITLSNKLINGNKKNNK